MTPIGMAIGLGVRSSYNPEGTTASIVTGVLDALSAGILLYTGMPNALALLGLTLRHRNGRATR